MRATSVITAHALLLLRPPQQPLPRTAPAVVCKVGTGPPPIKSRFFQPLGSPANYTALIEGAAPDEISVIKFQAPYCRTCRATSPLLDRVAVKYPQAKYFSMDLVRNGKAAGERMNIFYKEKGIKLMPYVEIYIGSECVDTEVVAPSALATVEQAIGEAFERLRDAAAATSTGKRGASRQLVLLRQFLRDKQAEVTATTRRAASGGARQRRRHGAADDDEAAPSAAADEGVAGLFASVPWQLELRGTRRQGGPPRHRGGGGGPPSATGGKKRGAPLRGSTGGRRKGWR